MVELTLKAAGAVVLLISSVVYGRLRIRDLRRRLAELEAFLSLVIYIKDNVEHFMKPIPEIISEFRCDALDSLGFLKRAIETDLHTAWTEAGLSLSGDAVALLEKYFQSVGKGYADEENKLSEYTAKRLGMLVEKEKAEIKDKERIYGTVPPMLACSVVLILI